MRQLFTVTSTVTQWTQSVTDSNAMHYSLATRHKFTLFRSCDFYWDKRWQNNKRVYKEYFVKVYQNYAFFQPILPPSGPCNAPWFSSETLALSSSPGLVLTSLEDDIALSMRITLCDNHNLAHVHNDVTEGNSVVLSHVRTAKPCRAWYWYSISVRPSVSVRLLRVKTVGNNYRNYFSSR